MSQSQDEQMEIHWGSIFKDLRKSAAILILAAIIGLLGAFSATTFLYRPHYSSSVTFVAEMKNSTSVYAGLSNATRLAAIFQDVMNSDILAQKAAEYMGEEEFPGTIETKIIDSTNLFVVTVSAEDPKVSFDGIQAIVEVYPQVSDNLFENAVMRVISVPKAPDEPANPQNLLRNMALGMIGMLVVCGGVIVLLSVFRDTIKSERNIRRKLDTGLFGSVIHEKKKVKNRKTSLLLNQTTISMPFRQSFQRIRLKLEYVARKKGYKVFMVTSAGENEGKSTVAANIALSLAQKGKSVLLMDADLRKPAVVKVFDKQKEFNGKEFGEYLLGKLPLEEVLTYDSHLKMYLLMGTMAYQESPEMLSSKAMMDVLSMARKELDYVIIDTAPMLLTADAETLAAYVDASLLVIREDVIRTKDLNDLINILHRSNSELLGCIYNDASKVSADRASIREYRGYSENRTAEA